MIPTGYPELPSHALPNFNQTQIHGSSTKRRDIEREESEPEAKMSFVAPMVVDPEDPISQRMGEIAKHFFKNMAVMCDEVCERIGHPPEAAMFHRQFIGSIIQSLPSNRGLTAEKVLELMRMILGQTLNLASKMTHRVLQNREDLNQRCETLKARLLNMTIQDLGSQADDSVESLIPGPLFTDVIIFTTELESALQAQFHRELVLRLSESLNNR